jgi:hypothetical protein
MRPVVVYESIFGATRVRRGNRETALPNTMKVLSFVLAKSVALSFTTPTLSSWEARRKFGACPGPAPGKVRRAMPKNMVASLHSNRR